MLNKHKTVLLHETIDGLSIKPHDVIVDGTLGSAGHTEEIIKRHGNTVSVIGIDQDKDALLRSELRLKPYGVDVKLEEGNFRDIRDIVSRLGIQSIDKMLLDLGVSSNQLEDVGRGFSFLRDEPLLMTMKKNPDESDVTAYEIVNSWGEESLADIIYGYGEEQFSRRIAKAIVLARATKPIQTTFELVDIIKSALPAWYLKRKIHPATKTFQAIRIAVNDELQVIGDSLESAFQILNPEGRIAVITFHSLEDRIVKRFFKQKEVEGLARLINKKPILPSEQELKENNRSRSAKLRILEKL